MLIAGAGLAEFHPRSVSFRCEDPQALLVPLSDIQGPNRTSIAEERAHSILTAISQDIPLPPVEVHEPPSQTAGNHRYGLRNGFHRYHIALALGFSHIPVVVHPFFDWSAL